MAINASNEVDVNMDRSSAIRALHAAGAVTAGDIGWMRREILCDRAVTREEADALFDLECANNKKCAAWTSFFVEALTDHVVWQSRPTGTVDEAQGEWLLARAGQAGSVNALALLVNVLAEANRVPLWFLAAVRGLAARDWPGVDAIRAGMLPASEAA